MKLIMIKSLKLIFWFAVFTSWLVLFFFLFKGLANIFDLFWNIHWTLPILLMFFIFTGYLEIVKSLSMKG